MTGWMLGPILFGTLIDDICIQWEKDTSCTGSSACRLYDNDDFRLKLNGYSFLFRVISVVLVLAAFIVAKVTRTFEVKDRGVSVEVKDEIEVKAMAMTKVNKVKENQ
jgi:hypothetical protein